MVYDPSSRHKDTKNGIGRQIYAVLESWKDYGFNKVKYKKLPKIDTGIIKY